MMWVCGALQVSMLVNEPRYSNLHLAIYIMEPTKCILKVAKGILPKIHIAENSGAKSTKGAKDFNKIPQN
jgi:hypothetical protein